ncbi:MAG: T9SS type A sorting domain-containing protein [Bacteroidetes bacterium]|nr:T9SS type A sorting domain-containing protein [Bacteroidota bacterium]
MKLIEPRFKLILFLELVIPVFLGAAKADAQSSSYVGTQQSQWFKSVATDKARYDPLSDVNFVVLFKRQVVGRLYVVYQYLDSAVNRDTILVQNSDSVSWTWQAPDVDGYGYMVELFLESSDTLLDHANIAVDVSSDWTKFPRYGFLSNYPYMSRNSIDSVISNLNRYHINGIQFYDWQYKHNEPLAGTVQNPSPTWHDIANRTNYLSTVEGYINSAHRHGMKAMNYNLLYGAYANAYQDGVNVTWSLFRDPNHQSRTFFQLPSSWASSLYIMDPSNSDWKNYIYAQERRVFLALPFDGWHVDQLGYLGPQWNYNGQTVDLPSTFTSFLSGARTQLNVDLVMNAVGQYGQSQIAQAPVDFLYTEVWDPDSTYADLVKIINDNTAYSNGKLKSVLAAYMDYDFSSGGGFFNTPGVLLTDAVIFAAGGDHLELGEHMLSREYFPYSNLQMSSLLQDDLAHYYDFLVAYENLLRDGEEPSSLSINAKLNSASIVISPSSSLGKIWSLVTAKGNEQIVSLINLTKANSLAWRDTHATQTTPDTLSGLQLSLKVSNKVLKIWTASPDFYDGSPVDLPFTQSGSTVSFILPSLLYWDMIVVQYDTTATSVETSLNGLPESFFLSQNYPNPFNPSTTISYELSAMSFVSLKVYDVLGREVATLVSSRQSAGAHTVIFNAANLPSGVYFYRLTAPGFVKTEKMVLMQ